jgi:hypothetical protein
MGFLGKMVAKAVVKKVETAAMYGVVSHMENTRSVDALVNKSTANYMLFIKKKSRATTFIGISILALLLMSLVDCHFFNVGPVLFYSIVLAVMECAKKEEF